MKRLIVLLLSIGLLLVAFGALAQPPPATTADLAILLCEKGAMIPPTMLGPILAQLEADEKGSTMNSPDQALAKTDFENFGRVSIAELERPKGDGILFLGSLDPTEANTQDIVPILAGKDTAI